MEDSSSPASGYGHDESIDEAFQLLADETRVAIMQALWEAYDPMDPTPTPFSGIRERVGVEDPGRLNYHLGELTTQFVRRTDEGYELREAGKRVMRVIVSGTATDGTAIEPTEIDVSCIFCDGPTEIEYRDGLLSHRCRECNSRCVADYPRSLLSREELPPAGLVDRTADEVYRSSRVWATHREASVMDCVCPECAGAMPVRSIRICDDHDPDPTADDVCESCGTVFWGIAHHVCQVCKFHMQLPTSHYPPIHPSVIGFYDENGIEFDLASHEQLSHLLEYRQEVIEEDPLRIRTTIPLDGDELKITFDDQMTVVDVDR